MSQAGSKDPASLPCNGCQWRRQCFLGGHSKEQAFVDSLKTLHVLSNIGLTHKSVQEIEAVPMDVLPKELFEKSGISSMKVREDLFLTLGTQNSHQTT